MSSDQKAVKRLIQGDLQIALETVRNSNPLQVTKKDVFGVPKSAEKSEETANSGE